MASIDALAAAAAAAAATPPSTGGDVGGAPAPEPPAAAARGAFIVLEGLDRSGKTTQVKLLQTRFVEAGKKVKAMRFPDRTTPTGQIINTYLTSPSSSLCDQAIHLLFTANRWESASLIISLVSQGYTVLCDRYYYSGMVYSAAKQNPALPLAWARAPEVGLPRPDLVVFLDLHEDRARERGGWGGERYEKREMQERVKGLFWGLKEGTLEGGFEEERQDLAVVDAGSSVEEVAEKIWRLVKPRVEEVESGKVGRELRTVS